MSPPPPAIHDKVMDRKQNIKIEGGGEGEKDIIMHMQNVNKLIQNINRSWVSLSNIVE